MNEVNVPGLPQGTARRTTVTCFAALSQLDIPRPDKNGEQAQHNRKDHSND